ncbi:MAG: ACT domain-containing protein [Ktedonobacteraceae bacterium]|nr:ACT domain-containing protein [Ktedonobacteraceae bacterium]
MVVPSGVQYEGSWKAIKVHGPLDFSLTGILVALAAPLACAGISIFALSTFDTDYLLQIGSKTAL